MAKTTKLVTLRVSLEYDESILEPEEILGAAELSYDDENGAITASELVGVEDDDSN